LVVKVPKPLLFLLFSLIFLNILLLFLNFSKKQNKKVSIINIDSSAKPPLRPLPTEKPADIDNFFTIAAVGDISLAREVNFQIQQRNDPNFPFLKTAEILKKADFTLGNLESPLIENCPTIRTGVIFCGQITNISGLVFAGFDAVNLANNHILNYGLNGFNETLKTLNENKIDYFNEKNILYKKIKNINFALLGFDDIVRPINKTFLAEIIKKAKENADFIVVNFHWGSEYEETPSLRQKELAYFTIDQGADLILGHHPHTLQPLEYYKEKPIIYSLGNFVFDQMWSEETKKGAIAEITIDTARKKISDVNFVPILIEDSCQPVPIF